MIYFNPRYFDDFFINLLCYFSEDKNKESTDPDDGDGSSNNLGAIVGGVIAGLVAVLLIIVVARKKFQKTNEQAEMGPVNWQLVPVNSHTQFPPKTS